MDSFTPLDNRIIDHWIFQDPEHFKVWFYMIHCAQYSPEEKTDYKYGILCTTGPGDFIFGYESWSRKLNVSVKKLRNLIKKLLAENMIVNQCTKNKFTIYRLVNYEKYRFSGIQKGIVETLQSQGLQDDQGRQEGIRGAGRGQAEGRQGATNKNIEEGIDVKEGEESSIPYGKVVDLWNSTVKALPHVDRLTAGRKKIIKARFEDGGMELFEKVFRKVSESNFLTGKTEKVFNGCGFDWVIKEANWTKIAEGNYDNKQQSMRFDPMPKEEQQKKPLIYESRL